MREDEVEEKDHVTNLYPFTLSAAAGGACCDLSTIYYLLRCNPSLLEISGRLLDKRKRGVKMGRSRQRKRG